MNRDRTRSRLGLVALLIASLTEFGCGRLTARRELKAGNNEYRKERYEEALAHYARVPSGSLDATRAALNSGYAHMAQYRFGSKHTKDLDHAKQAVEYFDAYLASRPADRADSADFPGFDTIEEKVITLLVDADRFQDAITRLDKDLQAKPGDIALTTGLAAAYDKWEKPAQAIRYYQKLAELEPDKATRTEYISQYAWDMSYRKHMTLEPIQRNRWIDLGLDAAEAALKKNPESFNGNVYKNLLLRERAKMRIDPDEIARLYVEANVLQRKAKEIREREKAAEEAKKAAEEAAKANKKDGAT